MPDSSSWHDICRWEFRGPEEEEFGETFIDLSDEEGSPSICQQDRDNKVILLDSTVRGMSQQYDNGIPHVILSAFP